jgi:hypothetical protein
MKAHFRVEIHPFTNKLHHARMVTAKAVTILDEAQVPLPFREIEVNIPGQLWQTLLLGLSPEQRVELTACVRQMKPSNDGIKRAAGCQMNVPGAEGRRGFHLRVS